MCRVEESQDCCSELEHDELELQLCDVETAYVHLDRGLTITRKDELIIKQVT
jgi:N-dimethylarginine dimethylaminohydrolase